MHRFGLIVGVILSVVAGHAPVVAAQVQGALPRHLDVSELERLTVHVAERDRIRRQLESARASVRSDCRFTFFSSRQRTRQRCDAAKARVAALERQLRGGASRQGKGRVTTTWSRERRGTYRTICVRICDGYYYSLSHTASQRRFKEDASKCAGQYPPGQAVLYYHPFPNDDVSQARSLDGKRYADQDYAFAFRTRFMPQCAARLQEGLAALRERVYAAVPDLLAEPEERAVGSKGPTASVPVPLARQHGSSDPETRANRVGRFVPREASQSSDEMRTVGDPYHFPVVRVGPPATVAGYVPPERVDYRLPEKSSELRAIR